MSLPLSAFLLGALGAAHCATMCGGFAAVGASRASRATADVPSAKLAGRRTLGPSMLVAQNAGRVAAYALFGLASGALGGIFGRRIALGQAALEVFSSVLLIGVGLFLLGLLPAYALVERVGAPLFRAVAPRARRLLPLRTPLEAALFGVAWGLLPCGLVYTALALAAASGTASQGALIMFSFGLGTLPALLAMGVLADALATQVSRPVVRRAAGASLVAFGVLHVTLAAERLSAVATH